MNGPVIFDGAVLGTGPITGVGRALLNALPCYAADAAHPPLLLLPTDAPDPRIAGVEVVRGPRGFVARGRRLRALVHERSAALLHSPVAALPARCPCPTIATVHDLPWMAQPALLDDDGGGWRHRLALRHAAHSATALLCVSRDSRRTLLRYLGRRPRAKVRVVSNGVPRPLAPAPFDELDGPLLTLAANRPRKNLARLRRAHDRASRIDSAVPPLRVLGPPDAYVSEVDKLDSLRHCTALLHLSLFEGFGLPVVEAFQHGVPVVCSDRGALREVAGDAACVADPENEAAMAAAIVAIATDRELRAALRTRGLARAARFTPERTAAAWHRIHAKIAR